MPRAARGGKWREEIIVMPVIVMSESALRMNGCIAGDLWAEMIPGGPIAEVGRDRDRTITGRTIRSASGSFHF